jgi:hypothetical protein
MTPTRCLAILATLASADALACPAPARPAGSRCVLDADVVLDEPLMLASGTHLDCRGFELRALATGAPDRPQPPGVVEHVRSVPEVALVIADARGVTLKNCTIGDEATPFDFGVLVLDGGGHAIVGNSVTARYTGVTLVRSSDNVVAGNGVTFGIGAHGRGIAVYRNSDRNWVVGNTIAAHSIDARTLTPTVPQAAPQAVNSRGINSATLSNAVLSFVYGGRLFQAPITAAMVRQPVVATWLGSCGAGVCSGDAGQACRDDADCSLSVASMSDDWVSQLNVYLGNHIDFLPHNKVGWGILVDQVFGIVLVGARDSTIAGNTIANTNEGIHFGAAGHDNMTLAGTCTLDAARWCGGDADCFVAGVDAESKGTCAGTRTFALPPPGGGAAQNNVNIGAEAIIVAANVLRANDQGINVTRGSSRIVVAGNDIGGGNTGLVIRQNGVDSTVLERNRVHGSRFAIVWDQGVNVRAFSRATRFGSTMRRNDLVDSVRAALSLGVCSNFALALACHDASDCDNSCTAGACAQTGEPCAVANDCRGQGNSPPVGNCLPSFDLAGSTVSGNHWGLTCEEGGFESPDESLFVDEAPHGQPVSRLWRLPPACD